MSSFSSISTAMTALQAHRRAMDVAGQNIANVNTPGYTRQRVDLMPLAAPGASSLGASPSMAGAGVEVTGVSRLGDEFLTSRVRSQTSQHAHLQARAETLTSVERLLNEPGETGLAQQLSEMWAAWSNLGNNPDTLAAKTVLVNKTQAVVDAVKAGHDAIEGLWVDQRARAEAYLVEVNELTTQVAELNDAVLNAREGRSNELMDRRDQIVTRLVELTGATASPASGGVTNVYLNGNPVVVGIRATPVTLAGAATMTGLALPTPPPVPVPANQGPVRLAWPDGTAVGPLRGGELAGSFEALNSTLPAAAGSYDLVAAALVATVNGGYAAAADPPPALPPTFLVGTDAATLRLDAAVDPAQGGSPAAAKAGTPDGGARDGSVAAGIARLKSSGTGPDTVWAARVVDIGAKTQAATGSARVAATTLGAAVSDQQSAVAVSIDEETANLLVVQRAYEGAARVLTAVDQALDTIINRTGLVGRS